MSEGKAPFDGNETDEDGGHRGSSFSSPPINLTKHFRLCARIGSRSGCPPKGKRKKNEESVLLPGVPPGYTAGAPPSRIRLGGGELRGTWLVPRNKPVYLVLRWAGAPARWSEPVENHFVLPDTVKPLKRLLYLPGYECPELLLFEEKPLINRFSNSYFVETVKISLQQLNWLLFVGTKKIAAMLRQMGSTTGAISMGGALPREKHLCPRSVLHINVFICTQYCGEP